MTCIVGIEQDGKVWMGGDRAAVGDRHYLSHCVQPKVFRRGNFLIGFTSSFRMGQLLQFKLPLIERPTHVGLDEFMATFFVDAVRECLKDGGYTKVQDSREEVGTFLVGVESCLYLFDDDYNVRRPIFGYDACGSGVSVALGSLHASGHMGLSPAKRLNLALEAASEFVTTVRAPFDVLSI